MNGFARGKSGWVWRGWEMNSKGYTDGSSDQAGHGDSGGHSIEFVCARTGLFDAK